jgi:hypothetical protein
MITKAICPNSGREYLGLTKTEVDAIGDIIFSYMKTHPRDPANKLPPGEVLQLLDIVGALFGDDDFTRAQLEWTIKLAQRYQIGVPPVLLTPGTTYEKFRGTTTNDEYHWLRRYKYARWLQARAKKNGVNIIRELKGVPCAEVTGTPMVGEQDKYRSSALWLYWYQIAEEPQIAEMAHVLRKNREAEKKKRSGSRAGNRAKQLRDAGYRPNGYRWARVIDLDAEKEPS